MAHAINKNIAALVSVSKRCYRAMSGVISFLLLTRISLVHAMLGDVGLCCALVVRELCI